MSDEHWTNKKALSELVKNNVDITFVLSIGGWAAGGFSEVSSTQGGRELFASSAIEIMNKHRSMGIDVYEVSGVDAETIIGAENNIKKLEPINYTEIENSLEDGYIRYFDESAKALYLYNGNKVIVFDDSQSLAYKVDYVIQENLDGIMFWEYNGDQTGQLLKAIDNVMRG